MLKIHSTKLLLYCYFLGCIISLENSDYALSFASADLEIILGLFLGLVISLMAYSLGNIIDESKEEGGIKNE